MDESSSLDIDCLEDLKRLNRYGKITLKCNKNILNLLKQYNIYTKLT